MQAGTTQVRNVDPEKWREFRAEAVRHGVSTGQLLTQVLSEWLARQHPTSAAPGMSVDQVITVLERDLEDLRASRKTVAP